ncbi:hypothetical protein L227DRAFT_654768 [Lentinus tigrinus ALCF2SS1-6]|uniref:Uncharacterized protein n=1 Tax=Lentinus tigrinus ALCF2SS1-6 TaxID=1328759 RepID=A0A5C2S5D7_9APHY|nr:hypothetical protein L227DRAFT_654768 [Lentinus tigrinus ALCF2SS1-6]
MGQYWKIFNISRREIGQLEGGLKFGEFFFNKQKFLVRSLTIPFESPKLLAYYKLVPERTYEKGLLSLPNELLLEIINYARFATGHFTDFACFAITCRRILILSRHSLHSDKAVEAAGWYGCRIACIGDYARIDDLPDQIMNATQRAQLKKTAESHEDGEAYAGLLSRGDKFTSLYLGMNTWPLALRQRLHSMTKGDRSLYCAAVSVTYPHRDNWALFNVTKKVYVRASALAELAGKPADEQPFLPNCRVDLGHALLLRIAWSYDDSVALQTDIDIHRGPWAGDRFFISTMDRPAPWYNSDFLLKGWTDVSDEIVKDLKEIYEDDADILEGPVIEMEDWDITYFDCDQ